MLDAHWPSGEDDDDLDICQNDPAPPSVPLPQKAEETKTPNTDVKNTQQPIEVDEPQHARKETHAPNKTFDEKPKEDPTKAEHAIKQKPEEDAAKRPGEDGHNNADDETAKNKAEDDAE